MNWPRQRVLNALSEITSDGWPATVREIQERVGHASPSTTHGVLCSLLNEGLVRKHPRWRGGWLPAITGREAA